MTFLHKWQTQLNSLLDYMLVALLGAVVLACFSAKVRIRYFIGSVLFGALLGSGGQHWFSSEWAPIALTIIGVMTAPLTVAKISGMTIWEAVDELRARIGPKPPGGV